MVIDIQATSLSISTKYDNNELITYVVQQNMQIIGLLLLYIHLQKHRPHQIFPALHLKRMSSILNLAHSGDETGPGTHQCLKSDRVFIKDIVQ